MFSKTTETGPISNFKYFIFYITANNVEIKPLLIPKISKKNYFSKIFLWSTPLVGLVREGLVFLGLDYVTGPTLFSGATGISDNAKV